MKTYEFTVQLHGIGSTPEEAWQDAIEGFIQNPGGTPGPEATKVIEDHDEEPERNEP